MKQQVHVLTPGDHFSPATGSAVATVVNGLASASQQPAVVLVAKGTYPNRYRSADVVEYEMMEAPHGASRHVRAIDIVFGRLGLDRPWAQRVWEQTLASQNQWDSSYVIGHNSPALIRLVADAHTPVLYAHNDVLGTYSRWEAGRALARVHRLVSVSNFLADRLVDRIPKELQDRVRVVHNAVDAELFKTHHRTRTDVLRVGFVGRVIPDKGVHVLLDAVARTRRRDIAVTIIGSAGFSASGPLTKYEQELRRIAMRIVGPVAFTPFQAREALRAQLAKLDVVVVPSIWSEPFALVVLEAMAAGAAIVASEVGGIPEAAGGAGILTKPGDTVALAEALIGLRESPSLLDITAAAGRRRAEGATWARSATELAAALS